MQLQFNSIADFLAMEGHGPYVWAAYAVAVLVLVALALVPVIRQRQLRGELVRQQRIEERRRQGYNNHVAAAGEQKISSADSVSMRTATE